VWLFLLLCAGQAVASEPPPNFVVMVADDLGYGDLGVYGHPLIKTPNIDRLAAEGVRLTEFYSSASTCTPARVSLLTGRYAQRSGLARVLVPFEKWGLPASEVTLAEALRELGYRTGIVGKWHLGGRKPYRPLNHGFDEFYGVLHSNDMSRTYLLKIPSLKLYDQTKVVENPVVQRDLTNKYTRRAQVFLNENRDEPFFLLLSYTKPHRPVVPSDNFKGKSAHGPYGDAVEEIDWSVGEVMRTINQLALDERTFVIFTSDNGPWVRGAHKKEAKGGSAGPLRGGKGTGWEGGMRVPMIARWPGRLPGGEVRGGITTFMDIFPTLVRLAGGDPPDDRVIDGVDILPYLRGEAPAPHEELIYYFRTHLFAIRSGQWKLHLNKRDSKAPESELLKPVRCDPPELYDLSTDVGETENVAARHPEIVTRLRKRAEDFDNSYEPVMVLPPRGTSVYQGIFSGAPKDPNKVPHAKPREIKP